MFEPLLVDAQVGTAQPGWLGAPAPCGGFVADRRYGPSDRRRGASESADNDGSSGERAQASRDVELAAARAEGDRAGRIAAAEEFAQEKIAWGRLKLSLSQMDEQAEEILTARLTETVAALCERTLQPLALDQQALNQRCILVGRMIGETAGHLTLHIHPHDQLMLDPALTAQWTVKTDPSLDRGSLRLGGVDGEISDGPAEWRAAIADAIGLGSGNLITGGD